MIDQLLADTPIVPVVVIDDVENAVPLAETLGQAGINVIEITLRTPEALPSIERIAAKMAGIAVGAGTVWDATDLQKAIDAGAAFGVSPGCPAPLLSALADVDLPFLPGCQTASEMASIGAGGFTLAKFFPAEHVGGVAALKALADVHPALSFCPTGGIGEHNFRDYLALPSVTCVGGSWIAPRALIAERRWDDIAALCKRALRALN